MYWRFPQDKLYANLSKLCGGGQTIFNILSSIVWLSSITASIAAGLSVRGGVRPPDLPVPVQMPLRTLP